jgi:hypothetical protein
MSRPAPEPTQYSVQLVRGFLPGGKASGAWINHLPPFSAEDKNEWSYTCSPLICLHGVDAENFTLYHVRYDFGSFNFVSYTDAFSTRFKELATCSLPPSCKAKNAWSYISTPLYAFLTWWFVHWAFWLCGLRKLAVLWLTRLVADL